jgi:hypothetical protein
MPRDTTRVGLEAPSIADFSKVRDLFKLLAVGLVSELVLDMSIDLGRCLICVGLVGSFVVVGLGLRVVNTEVKKELESKKISFDVEKVEKESSKKTTKLSNGKFCLFFRCEFFRC